MLLEYFQNIKYQRNISVFKGKSNESKSYFIKSSTFENI